MYRNLLPLIALLTHVLMIEQAAAGGGCAGPLGYTKYSSSPVTVRSIPNPFSGDIGARLEGDGMHLDVAANRSRLWWANPKFTNAWICTGFSFPKDRSIKAAIGLAFWLSDKGDFTVVHALSDGRLSIDRQVGGQWTALGIGNVSNLLIDKANSLEVIVTGNRVQVILNDTRVSTFEQTPPSGQWRTGVFAQSFSEQGYEAVFPYVDILELK